MAYIDLSMDATRYVNKVLDNILISLRGAGNAFRVNPGI